MRDDVWARPEQRTSLRRLRRSAGHLPAGRRASTPPSRAARPGPAARRAVVVDVDSIEGRFLTRKKARAVSAPAAAAECSSLTLGERLAPHDGLELGFDDDAIDTVADRRRRVEPKELAAFMTPIGGSQGKASQAVLHDGAGRSAPPRSGALDAAVALPPIHFDSSVSSMVMAQERGPRSLKTP